MSQATPAFPVLRITLPDEGRTQRLGRDLAALVRPGDMITLSGGLGSGKTALARALIQAHLARFGLDEDVPSPSFTLVQTYESPELLLSHVDLYRIEDEAELAELGLADALDEGVLLVEWPEKAEDALARLRAVRLDIKLEIMEEGAREARLSPASAAWAQRLGTWGNKA